MNISSPSAQLQRDHPLTQLMKYKGPMIDEDGVRLYEHDVNPEKMSFRELLHWESFQETGRYVPPGVYACLVVDGRLWMSDTPAELGDHVAPVAAARMKRGGRGLVNGLGMGLIVQGMLNFLDHVDVVERDARIIRLVGSYYTDTYPGRVTLHHADAMTIRWPSGVSWDVAWHDIWPTIATDNLPMMATLHRKYGKRTSWQGSWARDECEKMRDVERAWGVFG